MIDLAMEFPPKVLSTTPASHLRLDRQICGKSLAEAPIIVEPDAVADNRQ
jgi:hypothetical protein